MGEITWRYRVVSDVEAGPVTTEQLRQLFASGELSLDTDVWCEAISQWISARAVAGFRDAVAAPAVLAPPPPLPAPAPAPAPAPTEVPAAEASPPPLPAVDPTPVVTCEPVAEPTPTPELAPEPAPIASEIVAPEPVAAVAVANVIEPTPEPTPESIPAAPAVAFSETLIAPLASTTPEAAMVAAASEAPPVPEPAPAPAQAQTVVAPSPEPSPVLNYSDVPMTNQEPHPWVRFWARGVDMCLLGMAAWLLLAVLSAGKPHVPLMLMGLLTPLALLIAETLLVWAFGTTPGKRMLGVRVETANGRRPSFGQALNRALAVWICGEGLGLPIVPLVTYVVGYFRLSYDGETSWDRNGGLRVRHEPCSAGRIACVVAATWLLTTLVTATTVGVTAAQSIGQRVTAPSAFARGAGPASMVTGPASQQTAPRVGPATLVQSSGWSELTPVNDAVDRRIEQVAGTWTIRVTRSQGGSTLTWTNVLTLRPDGRYEQRIRAMDGNGMPRTDLNEDWSGTWAIDGATFLEMVGKTSTAHHPTGRWTYALSDVEKGGLTLQRETVPSTFGGGSAATHPLYRYHRARTVAQAD